MKQRIAIIKSQAGNEAKKTGMVILGMVTGTALAKGMDKLGELMPATADFIKYAKPIVIGGGGFLIAAGTTKDEIVKHFGYGLIGAGAYQGCKLVPFLSENFGFSGLGQVSDTATNYYTESNLNNIDLGSFGLDALPVTSFRFENPQAQTLDLPELSTSHSINDNLGYNPSATDETDQFKGII